MAQVTGIGNTIYILVVVDVVNALTSKEGLAGNVWMFDTEKFRGESEATGALRTYVKNGDILIWSLASINPADNLQFSTNKPFYSLNGIANPAVPKVINPKPLADDQYRAQVSIPGDAAKATAYQYTMTLSINGADYTFDPYLEVLNAP